MRPILDASVLRITDAAGRVCGTGFPVTPRRILSCAHVIEAAGGQPHTSVGVVLPREAIVRQAVVLDLGWGPPHREDLALLELAEPLPASVAPLPLGPGLSTAGHRFISFGFAELRGDLHLVDGLWAEGTILGPTLSSGGTQLLQLRAQELTSGMSGAPVWDLENSLVVGLVTAVFIADAAAKSRDTAFATPIEVVAQGVPEIEAALTRRSPDRVSPFIVPFQAPPLPAHHVDRPEVSKRLTDRLIGADDRRSGVLVVSAIHGQGGIGKSTVAAALAHDPLVRQRFSAGIFWLTLGQEPDPAELLGELLEALGDLQPRRRSTATNRLRTLLENKAALVVLDDVWRSEDVRPFLAGGPLCRVLITTRRADVADEVGAELYELGVLSTDQALELLAIRLRRKFTREEREEAQRLARLVGNLPLALELAAARVARGVPWRELNEALANEVARLEALEGPRRLRGRGSSLQAVVLLSLQALRSERALAWEIFVWLGLLPEDATVAAPAVSVVCGIDETDAAELLELLWNDSLLLTAPPHRIGDQSLPAYRLHDLCHDVARRLLVAAPPEGLGFDLKEAHRRLLQRYRTRSAAAWHQLPDDGYIHRYLSWHLERGEPELVHSLLAEETVEGRNGWYEACERLGITSSYLADVSRAWQLAEREHLEQPSPRTLALQWRYALITASINDLAQVIPPAILPHLLDRSVWTPAQAIFYARRLADVGMRVEALLRLGPQLLKAGLVQPLLQSVEELEDAEARTRVLAALAPHLPTVLRELHELQQLRRPAVLPRYLDWKLAPLLLTSPAASSTASFDDPLHRAETLAAVVPRLPPKQLAEGIAELRTVENDRLRLETILRLAPRLTDELIPPTLDAVRQLRHKYDRERGLLALAEHASAEAKQLIAEDILAVIGSRSGPRRARLLASFIQYLPPVFLRRALDFALRIHEPESRASAMAAVAPFLSQDLHPTVFAACEKLPPDLRARVLTGLAPQLDQQTLHACLLDALKIASASARVQVLSQLVPHLPLRLAEHALDALRRVSDEWLLVRSLADMSPQLPRPLHDAALRLSCEIEDSSARAEALLALTPYVALGAQSEILSLVCRLPDESVRATALAQLAAHLSPHLVLEVLTAVQEEVEAVDQRVEVLACLIPRLEHDLIPRLLTTVEGVESSEHRARLLVELLPRLEGETAASVGRVALDLAVAVADRARRAELLTAIAAAADGGLLRTLIQTTQAIGDTEEEVEALAALARELDAVDHSVLVQDVSSLAGFHGVREPLLCRLAPMIARTRPEDLLGIVSALPSRERDRILGAASCLLPRHLLWPTIVEMKRDRTEQELNRVFQGLLPILNQERLSEDPHGRRFKPWQSFRVRPPYTPAQQAAPSTPTENLESFAEHEPRQDQALRQTVAALAVVDEPDPVRAWSSLAPYFTEGLFNEILQLVPRLDSAANRAQALIGLSVHLPVDMLEQALTSTMTIEDVSWRGRVLSALLPRLPFRLAERAIQAVVQLRYDPARSRALMDMAPFVPEPLLEQAYRAALAITTPWQRARVLAALLSRLSDPLAAEARDHILRISDPQVRARALIGLGQIQLSEILQGLARRPRRELLLDLAQLAGPLACEGGADASREILYTTAQVCAWWP